MNAELQAAWDGMRLLAQAPLALVVLAVTALCWRTLRLAALRWCALVFALAAAATGLPVVAGWPAWLAPAQVAALGLLLAGAWALPRGADVALTGAWGGVAFGVAAGLPTALPTEAAGTLLAGGALLGAATLALRALQRRAAAPAVRLVPRMLGAWLAAIGLLMLALGLRIGG